MWFAALLPLLEEAPTVAQGLATLFTHLHNEMAHGSGQTSPLAVTQQLLDGASSIIGAITTNTAAATEEPQEPAVSEAASGEAPAANSGEGGDTGEAA